jgi:glucokinase
LRDRFGLPVVLDHDVRAAGFAELTCGALRDVHDGIYVSLGTGVAAALIANGQVLPGGSGAAGELGHVVVVEDGATCACGQSGCLEAYASAAAVARRYRELRPDAGEVDAPTVVRRSAEGDRAAITVWDAALDALARGVLALVMLTDPERIAVGGGLSQAGDALFVPLRERMAAGVSWRAIPEIVPACHGSDAGRVGAALLAWQAVEDAS